MFISSAAGTNAKYPEVQAMKLFIFLMSCIMLHKNRLRSKKELKKNEVVKQYVNSIFYKAATQSYFISCVYLRKP